MHLTGSMCPAKSFSVTLETTLEKLKTSDVVLACFTHI